MSAMKAMLGSECMPTFKNFKIVLKTFESNQLLYWIDYIIKFHKKMYLLLMRDNVHFWRQSYFANTELGVQTLKSKQKQGYLIY